MKQESVQEYVVKTAPGAVTRMRASLLRTLPWSAWAMAVIAVFFAAAPGKGVSRLHLAVFPLSQSVSEIDQALGHFSGGRLRVR